MLLIIAIVGTTVAPWQLFFQQSNIIDKRITPRWINYERADTVIGAFVVVIGAGALICVTAFAFGGTADFGHFLNAGTVATQLGQQLGSAAGTIFAIVLLNASLIGAAAVTLATSYAFGDVFGASHSLNRGPLDAKLFYASFTLMVMAAAGIVLIPGAPLGLITTSVQALAGVLLPSATVFLLLLCNDREVLGPWVNAPWLNAVAALIVGALVELSLILMASTMFPHGQRHASVRRADDRARRDAGRGRDLRPVCEPPLARRRGNRCGRGDPEGQAPHVDDAAARAARAPGVVAGAQGGDAPAARLSRRGGAAAGREDRAARALARSGEIGGAMGSPTDFVPSAA